MIQTVHIDDQISCRNKEKEQHLSAALNTILWRCPQAAVLLESVIHQKILHDIFRMRWIADSGIQDNLLRFEHFGIPYI